MKTILDAVNTLKGVWPGESIQIIEIDGVEFSEKEFNAQVKECSNNFGLPSVTAKPVYTQAMLNGSVYPVAGMKCLFANRCDAHPKYEECTIEYIGDLYCVVILEDNRQGCSRIANYAFKPIDNLTPKEKAIDDIDKAITSAYQSLTDIYKSTNEFQIESITLFELIKNNKIHGVTWTGK